MMALKRSAFIEYLDNSNNPVDARVTLDSADYTCSRVEFLCKGTRLAQEKLYRLNSTCPLAVIDCTTHRYVGPMV